MGYFPFFIDIKGKKGLVVGGGRVAARKVEKLLPFSPRLTLIAPVILKELKENSGVSCLERRFRDEDVEGCMFVIAASDDEALNTHVASLCREKGILVNVVDCKENCSFLFPALVKEGKLTVGISTEGASPQAAAQLRSMTAQQVPSRMEEILDDLAELREAAKEQLPDPVKRAAFLKEAADLCMEKNRPLTEKEKDALLQGSEPEGKVILAGAGCGAFDLITIRALRAIRYAQVIVYDDLLDERLLAYAPESCEKIYVGKRSGKHSMPQQEINRVLIQKAKQGKQVVRLKGGDPFVFGRGGEEILALKKEGIETSLIPGITSAVALPEAAGIPVTHRGISGSFHVMTGHREEEGKDFWEELEKLSGISGTLIFLMGFQRLEEIAQKLIQYGKKPETPAAVIHGDFNGKIRVVKGTLEDIGEKTKADALKPPAVIVVGESAGLSL